MTFIARRSSLIFTVMDKENRLQRKTSSDIKDDRQKYSKHQLIKLEEEFKVNMYPSREQYKGLAKMMKISERKIQVWFQNRRARQRRLDRKATGVPTNPLPNMLYHLNTNIANGRSTLPLTVRNQNVENRPLRRISGSKLQERNHQNVENRPLRRISGSKLQERNRPPSTVFAERLIFGYNQNVSLGIRQKSIRGLSDVNDESLSVLLRCTNWDEVMLEDDVFKEEILHFSTY